ARRLGNLPAEAEAHNNIALAQSRLGGIAESHAHVRRALELYGEAGDRSGARACWRQALDVLMEVGDHNLEGLLARLQPDGHQAGTGVPAGGAEPAARA